MLLYVTTPSWIAVAQRTRKDTPSITNRLSLFHEINLNDIARNLKSPISSPLIHLWMAILEMDYVAPADTSKPPKRYHLSMADTDLHSANRGPAL